MARTDSPLTLAVDSAYDLNALLITCHMALDAMENYPSPSDIARIGGAVKRVLREVAAPLVGGCIDALELAESAEGARE